MNREGLFRRVGKFLGLDKKYKANFEQEASKFHADSELNDRGQRVYFRSFNKQQLVGKIIRVSKYSAYRVTSSAELDSQKRMSDGEHELRKLIIR